MRLNVCPAEIHGHQMLPSGHRTSPVQNDPCIATPYRARTLSLDQRASLQIINPKIPNSTLCLDQRTSQHVEWRFPQAKASRTRVEAHKRALELLSPPRLAGRRSKVRTQPDTHSAGMVHGLCGAC